MNINQRLFRILIASIILLFISTPFKVSADTIYFVQNGTNGTIINSTLSFYYEFNASNYSYYLKIIYGWRYYDNDTLSGSLHVTEYYPYFVTSDTVNLSTWIIANNYWEGHQVKIYVWLINESTSTPTWETYPNYLYTDNRTFNASFIYIPAPSPTPSPSPSPSPSPTPTPYPTTAPNISNQTTGYNESANQSYTLWSEGVVSGYNSTISSVFDIIDYPFSGMRSGIQYINSSFNNISYNISYSFLNTTMPIIISSIPDKIKALITTYLIMLVILIILGRD